MRNLKYDSKRRKKKGTHRINLTIDLTLSGKIADRIFNNTDTDWRGNTYPDEPEYSLLQFVLNNAFRNNGRTIQKVEITENK